MACQAEVFFKKLLYEESACYLGLFPISALESLVEVEGNATSYLCEDDYSDARDEMEGALFESYKNTAVLDACETCGDKLSSDLCYPLGMADPAFTEDILACLESCDSDTVLNCLMPLLGDATSHCNIPSEENAE